MYSFSVGVIAAIINAVVAILQILVPNALIFTLTATLSETHTAATWSVVARNLQSSLWPVLLRSDSAATKHVQRHIEIINLLRPLTLGLLGITAIVAPLGLYETIEPAEALRPVKFVRQSDEGSFGLLTPHRSDLGFSRGCSDGGVLPGQCPGTGTVITYADNGTTFSATIVNDDYDRRIPARLAALYQSGLTTQPASMSSFFDIEWRWYNTRKRDNMRNESYLVDSYRPIANVIGDGGIKLIEGLIVDSRNGGVGFRSHSVPASADVPYGADWQEDVLFFVPETACVDMNVTLENKVPSEYDAGSWGATMNIVDRGGFSNISHNLPWRDGWYGNTQQNPDLEVRAYSAAWALNVLNMFFLNVTEPGKNMTAPIESHIGKRFAVNNSLSYAGYGKHSAALVALAMVSTSPNGLIDIPVSYLNGSLMPSAYNSTHVNPHGIISSNYTVADEVCTNFFIDDWANSTNIQVKCGLVLGPALKTSGPDTPLVEPGSEWTRPVYMCASTTKATIKSVSFSFNQSRGSGLDALSVTSLEDKQYASKTDMPSWGIETPNMTLGTIDPLWGLIDPDSPDIVNVTMLQSPQLYVPAGSSAIRNSMLEVDGGHSYVPGTAAPAAIWASAYAPRDILSSGIQDLSGWNQLSLATVWRKMSTTSMGTAGIMNLIWTDLAANALVGTRGWVDNRVLPPNLQSEETLRKRDISSSTSTTAASRVSVRAYVRRTRYHWLYAIPAGLTLLLVVVICVAALVAVVSGKGNVRRIRHYSDSLSAGRLLVALKTGVRDFESSSAEWLKVSGRRRMSLANRADCDVLELPILTQDSMFDD
jgi:hypothetical protein